MALINCPECGKEVSNKAVACIHCGYPITSNNAYTDTNGITALFSNFAMIAATKTNVADIYTDVVSEVSKIKAIYSEQEANDIVAKSIVDGIIQIPKHIGWVDTKLYCELIDFKNLSSDAIEYFADKLYTVISMEEYYDDGSGGYCNLTQYFYAEYMVIQYACESTKEKYMKILSKPYMGHSTSYDYIVSMYKKHVGVDTMSQIAGVKRISEGIGGAALKCPVCGSQNVNRISTTGRLFSVATFGLASSKIGKQYECKRCKHKW